MISTQLKNVVREMLANPHVDLTRKIRILWRPELYSIQQKYHLPEANLMPKPYYKPPNLWNFCRFGVFFCILNSNLLLRNQQMCYN